MPGRQLTDLILTAGGNRFQSEPTPAPGSKADVAANFDHLWFIRRRPV
jgi:hypothetical protein